MIVNIYLHHHHQLKADEEKMNEGERVTDPPTRPPQSSGVSIPHPAQPVPGSFGKGAGKEVPNPRRLTCKSLLPLLVSYDAEEPTTPLQTDICLSRVLRL